jgi:hypothetical protein
MGGALMARPTLGAETTVSGRFPILASSCLGGTGNFCLLSNDVAGTAKRAGITLKWMQNSVREFQPFSGHLAVDTTQLLVFRRDHHMQTVRRVTRVFFVLRFRRNCHDSSLTTLKHECYAASEMDESEQKGTLSKFKGANCRSLAKPKTPLCGPNIPNAHNRHIRRCGVRSRVCLTQCWPSSFVSRKRDTAAV